MQASAVNDAKNVSTFSVTDLAFTKYVIADVISTNGALMKNTFRTLSELTCFD